MRLATIALCLTTGACVPALPGGTLGDPATSGTGGAAGMASPDDKFILYKDAGRPFTLAVAAGYVFWANSSANAIMKLPVGGGQPTTLSTMIGNGGIAADTHNVYWTDGTWIASVGIDGGPTTTLTSAVTRPRLVVGPDALYWIQGFGPDMGSVMKLGLGGGTPTPVLPGQIRGREIAVDATNLYWISGGSAGSVMRTAISGDGSLVELAGSQNDPSVLTVDATYVYWLNAGTETVMRVRIDGGEPEALYTLPHPPSSVAIDSSGVYWVSPGGAVYAGVSGYPPRLLAMTVEPIAYGVTLDATSVYWCGTGAGSILRAPK